MCGESPGHIFSPSASETSVLALEHKDKKSSFYRFGQVACSVMFTNNFKVLNSLWRFRDSENSRHLLAVMLQTLTTCPILPVLLFEKLLCKLTLKLGLCFPKTWKHGCLCAWYEDTTECDLGGSHSRGHLLYFISQRRSRREQDFESIHFFMYSSMIAEQIHFG